MAFTKDNGEVIDATLLVTFGLPLLMPTAAMFSTFSLLLGLVLKS
jgi:hypothetical protein